MMNQWEIKSRSTHCTTTNRPFEAGETFYTLLFFDKDGYRREDLCEQAFQERNNNIQPFSFWRGTFELPAPPAPEALPKESAEDLLRRVMEEDKPEQERLRYILALMLERKKILKPIETKETENGPLLIYEHAKTGELFLIPDPLLHLDLIDQVQMEVGELLGLQAPEKSVAPQELSQK